MKSKLTYLKKPELFKELDQHQDKLFAVIDDAVRDQMPDWVKASGSVFWLKTPEKNKNLKTFEEIVGFFLDQGISRSSKLYAIGGGATTDLSGFVAASVLRGISWISIPTTLLGIVDGAIGGKVAVNLPQGKNLVGAFHAPEQILICYDFLSTLPEVEWESGKGEILKYGFLSTQIFERILKHDDLENVARDCGELKKQIVESDFKEQGDRILLNLGHTMGHAFELTLKIPHGLAVVMGIKYLFEVLFMTERLTEFKKLANALNIPLEKTNISHYPDFSVDKFKNYLLQDKKKNKNILSLVVVESVGACQVKKMDVMEFINKIEANEDFKN